MNCSIITLLLSILLGHLREADAQYEQWSNCATSELEGAGSKRSKAMTRIQQSLIAAQELGDEKMQLVNQLQEVIDHKTRQLDHDNKNLDYGNDEIHGNFTAAMDSAAALKENSFTNVSSPARLPNSSPTFPDMAAQGNYFSPLYKPMVMPPNGGGQATFSSSTSSSNNGATGGGSNGGNGGGNSSCYERSVVGGNSKRSRRTRTDTINGLDNIGSDSNSLANESKCFATSQAGSSIGLTSTDRAQQQAASNKKAQQNSGKKKKRKSRLQTSTSGAVIPGVSASTSSHLNSRDKRDDTPPQDDVIDPDEPTYCICDQISFGEMILCDNDLCPIEWFHFSCVELVTKPKGKWYCPNCRGERPNLMKPKAQFLRELERYNKEREEKT